MRLLIILFFSLVISAGSGYSKPLCEDPCRGTIRVKKPAVRTVYINRYNSEIKEPRFFMFRAFGALYKEYFPAGYQSDVFPMVYNNGKIVLVNAKKNFVSDAIGYFQYEVCMANIGFGESVSPDGNIMEFVNQLKFMPKGSSIWIKKMAYTDASGKIHSNEIGEFKIEKIQ